MKKRKSLNKEVGILKLVLGHNESPKYTSMSESFRNQIIPGLYWKTNSSITDSNSYLNELRLRIMNEVLSLEDI